MEKAANTIRGGWKGRRRECSDMSAAKIMSSSASSFVQEEAPSASFVQEESSAPSASFVQEESSAPSASFVQEDYKHTGRVRSQNSV